MVLLTEKNILPNGKYYCHSNIGNLSSILHSHEFYEFFLVVSGIVIHNFKNEKYTMNPGDFVCIFPGKVHKTAQQGDIPPKIISLAISRTMWDKWCSIFPNKISDSGNIMTMPTQDIYDIKESFEKIHSLNEDLINDRISTIASKFFSASAEAAELSSVTKDGNDVIKRAILKMKEPVYLQGGMKSLIEITGYSRSHLYKIFPQTCGQTPHNYITELRLKRAENLLRYTDLSILEISMECGFSSVSHFIKLFKKKFSTVPTAFRKKDYTSYL